MLLTRLGHAALMIETPYVRVLCDPGIYSSEWHQLTDLDAVLVTHQHQDHVDVTHLAELMQINPTARLVVEEAVVAMLAPYDHLSPEAAVVGENFEVGPLRIEAHGGTHAVIHRDIPRIGNVGFVLQEADGPRVFHPGDSYDDAPKRVDVLALPLAAPWARVADTAEFLGTVAPREAIPIHDALLSEAGRATYLRLVRTIAGEAVPLHTVGPTDTFNV